MSDPLHFHIGTTNEGKVREIGAILSSTGCTFSRTDPVDPEETEDDFVGNALLKARVYAKHAGGLTISEDSGLIVTALRGLPGPWSARFADCIINDYRIVCIDKSDRPREVIDPINNERVLQLMKGLEMPHRAALFKVVLAVATPDGDILFQAEGESHGWIAEEARGNNGFGYDPIFIGQDTGDHTWAELDARRKNMRSHRRHVLDRFEVWLGEFLVKKI